jgi:pyrroloquinoline quinone biosynthesis protein B
MLLPCFVGAQSNQPYVIVLGVAQDGGLPHAGCDKSCCRDAWTNPRLKKMVSCLGIVDPVSNEIWMVDATPDFPEQYRFLQERLPGRPKLSGIFLTHAHVGHYTGLMHLGREVMGASQIPIYAMPRMREFLTTNGPWSQLVTLRNIVIRPLEDSAVIQLNDRLRVMPFRVPHRDEFSETVGFQIQGPSASAIYIPDIDKWEKWNTKIETWISNVDYAFIDGTFFNPNEIPGRNPDEIPHPLIFETMQRLSVLSRSEKKKVHFIHLNHTNPALTSEESKRQILTSGFQLSVEGAVVGL